MEDSRILELYWERSEEAITETQTKYGRYCHRIAKNILNSDEDAEECVNDTYVRAWNCMPPERPNKLGTFLGRITRNLALDRYDARRAHKRNGNMELALDELGECISDGADMPVSDEIVLKNAIDGFLEGLGRTARIVFMRRYWYLCSVSDIARSLGMSESNVKVTLMRTRRKFAEHLAKEGISI